MRAAGPPCSPSRQCRGTGLQGCGCSCKPSATHPSRAAACERYRWLRPALVPVEWGCPWDTGAVDVSPLLGLFVSNCAAGSMSPAPRCCPWQGSVPRQGWCRSLLPRASQYLTWPWDARPLASI